MRLPPERLFWAIDRDSRLLSTIAYCGRAASAPTFPSAFLEPEFAPSPFPQGMMCTTAVASRFARATWVLLLLRINLFLVLALSSPLIFPLFSPS